MKKFATATALTLIILNTSLAHQPKAVQNHGQPKPTIGKTRTAIKKELVHPVVRLPAKPKLLRSNPFRFTAIRLGDADPWVVPDDEDLAADRNRWRLVKQQNSNQDDDLSDYVQSRLVIARTLALAKYREKWQETV